MMIVSLGDCDEMQEWFVHVVKRNLFFKLCK